MSDVIQYLGDSVLAAKKLKQIERHQRVKTAEEIVEIAKERFAFAASELIDLIEDLPVFRTSPYMGKCLRYALEARAQWEKCCDEWERIRNQNREEIEKERGAR